MKTAKSVAMFAVIAVICGSTAFAAGEVSSAHGASGFAVAGFLLIGLSTVLRRRNRHQ